jgi:DNA-binding MarR family transcriptional regulator
MARLTIDACAAQRSPGRLMRRLDKIMSAYVESRFDEWDLSFTQWVALKVVRDGIARNAGELARELSITTGATTRMIDALEERGLLIRERDGADRRVVHLATTSAGLNIIDKIHARVAEGWNEVLAELDQAEVDAMTETLVKLLAAAERVTGQGDMVKEAAQ